MEWISVKTRLPEPRVRVLIFWKYGDKTGMEVDFIEEKTSYWFDFCGDNESELVTHWAYISPPKE